MLLGIPAFVTDEDPSTATLDVQDVVQVVRTPHSRSPFAQFIAQNQISRGRGSHFYLQWDLVPKT